MSKIASLVPENLRNSKPSLIRVLNNKYGSNPEMINLTVGEPDFKTADHVKLAVSWIITPTILIIGEQSGYGQQLVNTSPVILTSITTPNPKSLLLKGQAGQLVPLLLAFANRMILSWFPVRHIPFTGLMRKCVPQE